MQRIHSTNSISLLHKLIFYSYTFLHSHFFEYDFFSHWVFLELHATHTFIQIFSSHCHATLHSNSYYTFALLSIISLQPIVRSHVSHQLCHHKQDRIAVDDRLMKTQLSLNLDWVAPDAIDYQAPTDSCDTTLTIPTSSTSTCHSSLSCVDSVRKTLDFQTQLIIVASIAPVSHTTSSSVDIPVGR